MLLTPLQYAAEGVVRGGHSVGAVLRRWVSQLLIASLRWLMTVLITFLPEEHQHYIQDCKRQINIEERSGLDVQLTILSELLVAYKGLLLENAFDSLRTLPNRIDPKWVFENVFKRFGTRVIDTIEESFIEEHYRISLSRLRLIGPLVIVFNLIFAVLDIWCLPETYAVAWVIRTAVCILAAAVTLLGFRASFFPKFHQMIIGGLLATAGLGIILIISLSESWELGHTTYYASLLLINMCICLLAGLRYPAVLLVSGFLFFSYEVAELLNLWPLMASSEQALLFFNNSFFLLFSIVIGWTSSNALERALRISFMIRYVLSHTFRNFLQFFGGDSPKQLLQTINQLREQPTQLSQYLAKVYTAEGEIFLPQSNAIPQLLDIPVSAALPDNSGTINEAGKQNIQPESEPFLSRLIHRLFQNISAINASIQRFNRGISRLDETKLDPGIVAEFKDSFLEDYFYGSVRSMRVTALSSSFSYSVFVIADWVCLPETRMFAFSVRLLFLPIAAWLVYVSFFQIVILRHYHQLIMATIALCGGFGINLMIAFAMPQELGYQTYYAGLIMVFYYVFSITRLRFVNAALVGISIVVGYVIIALVVQGIPALPEGSALLANNLLFLTGSFSIGVVTTWLVDRTARLDFLLLTILSYRTKEMLTYQESSCPSPQAFWEMVRSLRYSPRKLEQFLIETLQRQTQS